MELSNKSLLVLILIMLGIFIVNIFIPKYSVFVITGSALTQGTTQLYFSAAQSKQGQVIVNISEVVSIKTSGIIDFGSGRVNSDANFAILDTHNDSGQAEVINGTWDPASFSRYLTIENDGTVNLNVTVYTNKTASSFIGGTNPSFMIKGIETETGACSSNFVTSYFELTGVNETTAQVICGTLQFGQANDEFNVSAKLKVPSDAPTGSRTAVLTFVGTQI